MSGSRGRGAPAGQGNTPAPSRAMRGRAAVTVLALALAGAVSAAAVYPVFIAERHAPVGDAAGRKAEQLQKKSTSAAVRLAGARG